MSQLNFQQQSLYEESVIVNGVNKKVHYVVKNTPFQIKVQGDDGPFSQLPQCGLQCALIVDSATGQGQINDTPVEYMGAHPFSFTAAPNIANGPSNAMNVDCRVKILSSQLQNSLFLIKLNFTTPNGTATTLYSHPIKVVSKPEQVRKKLRAAHQDVNSMPTTKKRARGEELVESLSQIRQRQHKALLLLQQLTSSKEASSSPSTSATLSELSLVMTDMALDYPSENSSEEEHTGDESSAAPSAQSYGLSEPLTSLLERLAKIPVAERRNAVTQALSASQSAFRGDDFSALAGSLSEALTSSPTQEPKSVDSMLSGDFWSTAE